MPDWLAVVIVALVSIGFAGAVAFGRRRQPCAVDPRIRNQGSAGDVASPRDAESRVK